MVVVRQVEGHQPVRDVQVVERHPAVEPTQEHENPAVLHQEVAPADTAGIEAGEGVVDAFVVAVVVVAGVHTVYVAQLEAQALVLVGLYAEPLVAGEGQTVELEQKEPKVAVEAVTPALLLILPTKCCLLYGVSKKKLAT